MLKSGVRAGPGGDLASAPTPCRGGWSRAKGWREECGVFAAIGVPSAAQVVGLGLHALQHRGQESAGIVSCGEDGVFHSHKGLGLVSEVFHTPKRKPYVRLKVEDHFENHPLRSKAFRSWLYREFHKREEKPPTSQAVE